MAEAKTLTVTNGHDHGPGSLRTAIDNAADGDVIEFASGVRSVKLTTSEIYIASKQLTINGPGARQLTIHRSTAPGTPEFRLFDLESANVTFSGLTLANGSNSDDGAGIYIDIGTVTLNECAVSGNKTAGVGAGISNYNGTLTINGCTISGNSAGEGKQGGGIYNGDTLTVTRSTLCRNSAADGGAIVNYGLMTITNSTVATNSASGSTGGIYNVTGSSAHPHIVRARNTIIAKNTDGSGFPDFSGRLKSLGYNLIGNTKGIVAISGVTTGNQRNVDPHLGPLQDNGGPTLTKALLSGSPAIDKGNSGGAATDQRGFVRPVDDPDLPNATNGDGSDIGAFEVQPPTSAPAAESPSNGQ